MPLNEDNRAASGLMANLSGFIITANLSMLAILGASYVFVAGGNNQTTITYNILLGVAFVCFVISIIAGGKGINDTATALSNSSWTIATATNKFDVQATLSLLGVVLFLIASIFCIENKDSKNNELVVVISNLNNQLSELSDSIKNTQKNNENIDDKLGALELKVNNLEQKLFNITPTPYCKVIDTKIDGGQLFCPDGFMFKGAEKHPSKNGTLDKIICCK